jgi:glycosyltransferase involved in cell wall biosynthesis
VLCRLLTVYGRWPINHLMSSPRFSSAISENDLARARKASSSERETLPPLRKSTDSVYGKRFDVMTQSLSTGEQRAQRAAERTPGTVLLVGNFVPVTASYGSVSQELGSRLECAGWSVIRTSYRQQKALKVLDMLHTCWMERNRFDVAHVEVYSGKAFIWAEAVCGLLRRLGKPHVVALHGGNLPNFLRKREGRARKLLQSAFAVVSPSPYLQEALLAFRPDVQLMPNALDLGSYPGRVRYRVEPKLIWLRAFRKMYAPEVAVEAFATIASDFVQARLTMIGPDRKDGSLEKAMAVAQHLGVADRVSFVTGVPKSEVASHLNKEDIFLNTTTIDNTPVSVIEALACGLCVVSTNVGGIPHLLRDEWDGLLVQPGDAKALGKAIRRILTNDRLAAKLSTHALQKAKTFDWSVVLPRWHKLFLSVTRDCN